MNGDRVDPTLPYNEFLPDSDDLIMESFLEQFDTILGLIDIDSLIGDLAFTLPAINGVGLSDLEFAGTGQNSTDVGAFASIGVVPYTTGTGCGEEGDAGCEEGCSSNGSTSSKFTLLIGVLMFGLVRRRPN